MSTHDIARPPRHLGRVEPRSQAHSWRAEHLNTLADGISRCSRRELADKVRELTNSEDSVEQPIGERWEKVFHNVLQIPNFATGMTPTSGNPRRTGACLTQAFLSRRTRLPPTPYFTTRSCSHSPPGTPPPLHVTATAGAGHNTLDDKLEVAQLVERLALGFVGLCTQNHYFLGKWNIWVVERAAQGKGVITMPPPTPCSSTRSCSHSPPRTPPPPPARDSYRRSKAQQAGRQAEGRAAGGLGSVGLCTQNHNYLGKWNFLGGEKSCTG